VIRARDRQIRLAGGHAGDREPISGIRLARPPKPLPFARCEGWRHLHHLLSGASEGPGQRVAVLARALDPDPLHRAQLSCPGQQGLVAAGRIREHGFGQLAADLVNGASGQALFVAVDTAHQGVDTSP
jgi:hypothetical protein